MLYPAVTTRMVEGHCLTGHRVKGFDGDVLTTVTSLTRPRQIFRVMCTAPGERNDVFHIPLRMDRASITLATDSIRNNHVPVW
jgi:hypothetical protein